MITSWKLGSCRLAGEGVPLGSPGEGGDSTTWSWILAFSVRPPRSQTPSWSVWMSATGQSSGILARFLHTGVKTKNKVKQN